MGVWIETASKEAVPEGGTSHPVWVCGLKQDRTSYHTCEGRSHPVWVCGLKHLSDDTKKKTACHTLYGCVD